MNSNTLHFGVSKSMAYLPDSWLESTYVHLSFCLPRVTPSTMTLQDPCVLCVLLKAAPLML